ncbi:MAG: aminodeoxychorismate synthase component I [bacterium]|nr:aminodeoxychorismate synthase component I [bacterium]
MNKAEKPLLAPWFLFDTGEDPQAGSALLLEDAVKIICADEISQIDRAIEQLNDAIDSGLTAAGFFSYELGYGLEPSLQPLMSENRRVPLIWFALYPKTQYLRGPQLEQFLAPHGSLAKDSKLKNISTFMTKQDYLRRFALIKELIGAGDIYQVNLTFKLALEYEGSPFDLYAALRKKQPVSYGAYLECKDFSILSHSPELFFEINNGDILSRPMKGTIKRGVTPSEDQALSRELQGGVKNRAENLMIVDLMRNDLSRICEVGSVEVRDLYEVKALPTLYQMTSDVIGRLRADVQLGEIIKALVPAGSITGAPKIRAQEIISDLEEQPRGVYCGAIGVLARDQKSRQLSARFNVAIRSLTLFPDGHGETGIGSGVVQDSKGDAEYEECLLKAKFMIQADLQLAVFELIETMRLDRDGSYYLRERHLSRLVRSCKELGFSCPVEEIDKELGKLARQFNTNTYLVRLLLSVGGEFTLTSTKIDPPDPAKIISFVVSGQRVESTDTLLAHKTTRRQIFDEELARANKRLGVNEVLFLNERDELTEGSRSTLFIERDGELHTPPLSSGLLPGTLRAQLIDEGRVVESILTLNDLVGVKIFLGNSVRGLQPARLLEEK